MSGFNHLSKRNFHLNAGKVNSETDKNKNPVYLSYLLYLPSHLVEPPWFIVELKKKRFYLPL